MLGSLHGRLHGLQCHEPVPNAKATTIPTEEHDRNASCEPPREWKTYFLLRPCRLAIHRVLVAHSANEQYCDLASRLRFINVAYLRLSKLTHVPTSPFAAATAR